MLTIAFQSIVSVQSDNSILRQFLKKVFNDHKFDYNTQIHAKKINGIKNIVFFITKKMIV